MNTLLVIQMIVKLNHSVLPKSSAYVKRYNSGTKQKYFLNEDEEQLKNEMIFEIKSYDDEATDFPDKEMPKVDFNCTCLAVVVYLAYV